MGTWVVINAGWYYPLPFVQSPSQAQRLAKQFLQRAQYPGTFAADFLATAWRCRVGSIVRLTFPALGFSAKLFRVLEHTIRFDGVCPMVLREEHSAIYAWAASESPAVQAATPNTYDPLNNPIVQAIDEAASSGIVAFLTNESHTVAASSAGVVSSFADAGGFFKVYSGEVDVSTVCTFSVASETGVDISIDTPTGEYTIASMSADSGSAVLQANYGGLVLEKVYSISKSRAGSDGSGDDARLMTIISDRQTIAYDAAGLPSPTTQTTNLTAQKQNTTATVTWSVQDATGVARTPTTTYLSAATGNSVTMTEGQFANARNSTSGVIITATLTDGVTLTDKISIVRVQQGAAGSPGTAGAPGAPGAAGASYYVWIAYADSNDGALNFTTGAPGNRAFIGIAANRTTAVESSNPADYQWAEYKGPTQYGLVNQANVAISSNKITKTGGVNGTWDASAYSSEAWIGGTTCSFKLGHTTGGVIVGLNTDPTTNANFTSIDYAIYAEAGGTCYAIQNGVFVATLGGGWTADTVFSIHYDGQQVRYYTNGTLRHTQSGVASGLRLFLDSSFATVGTSVQIVGFTAAGSVGASGPPGPIGQPGVGFYQDTSPGPGSFVGQMWVLPTSKRIFAWNGSAWVQHTGNIAVLDSIGAGNILVSNLAAISAIIGTLRTAASGARMEVHSNVIKVYDASNVLRVQLGDLSL